MESRCGVASYTCVVAVVTGYHCGWGWGFEGSRCSNEIRINVLLTPHLGGSGGSLCSSFISPSIYQRHAVNYCFVNLCGSIHRECKPPPLPPPGKRLPSGLISPTTAEQGGVKRCQTSLTTGHFDVGQIRSWTPWEPRVTPIASLIPNDNPV